MKHGASGAEYEVKVTGRGGTHVQLVSCTPASLFVLILNNKAAGQLLNDVVAAAQLHESQVVRCTP